MAGELKRANGTIRNVVVGQTLKGLAMKECKRQKITMSEYIRRLLLKELMSDGTENKS